MWNLKYDDQFVITEKTSLSIFVIINIYIILLYNYKIFILFIKLQIISINPKRLYNYYYAKYSQLVKSQ